MYAKLIASAFVLLVIVGVALAAPADRTRMAPAPGVAAMLEDLSASALTLPRRSPVREAVESGDLARARALLEFRPLAEAPVPEGFPPFTPVGVIELKEYPAYRKAEGPGFWPLFQHIQSEKIPMTAPVEMSRPSPDGGRRPMAFLYQSPKVGRTGPANEVVVVDAEKTLAVSLGVRGRMTETAADDARARLEAWLADHGEYLPAGENAFRLFGYNSPMVPDSEKYWEAQIVIRPAESAVSGSR